MINRKAMKIGEQVERQLAAAVSEVQEGAVLCEIIEDGVSKVTVVAAPSGAEKIAGFAILPYQMPTQSVAQEAFVVPASGSLIFNLRNPLVITGSARAMVVGGSDLTVDETSFSATPPTGTVKVDIVGGRIKFAAGDAGKSVQMIYRHSLTVQQARQRFHERSINNRDLVAAIRQVGVAKGYVEIATDQFVTTVDYSTGSLLLGANGLLTNTGSGPAIPQGKVMALPDMTDSERGAFLKVSALIG